MGKGWDLACLTRIVLGKLTDEPLQNKIEMSRGKPREKAGSATLPSGRSLEDSEDIDNPRLMAIDLISLLVV